MHHGLPIGDLGYRRFWTAELWGFRISDFRNPKLEKVSANLTPI